MILARVPARQLLHVFLRKKLNFPISGSPSSLVAHLSSYHNVEGGGQKKRRSGKKELLESTILYQDGLDIQELPVTVLPSNDPIGDRIDTFDNKHHKSYKELSQREEGAFIEGFSNFHTPKEVLRLLDTIPVEEVTPAVSLSILRKLFELQTGGAGIETFARMAIVSRLIDIIISCDEHKILLEALDVLKSQQELKNGGSIEELTDYRDKLCQEILIRVTHRGSSAQLTLEEVCRAIISLGRMTTFADLQTALIDKLWVGILDHKEGINSENIALVFRTLPHFSTSQRIVLNLLEKKLLDIWLHLKPESLAQICEVVGSGGIARRRWDLRISTRFLTILLRSASLNIHALSEDELRIIVRAFIDLNFNNDALEKAVSKYMKTKCLRVQNPDLVSTIMEYTVKFNIRSPEILNAGAEYLILKTPSSFSPPQLKSMLLPFGTLSFQPPNGVTFWKLVEEDLLCRFSQFHPADLISLLLSFVYLQKYPLNFVSSLFSPYFLDRVHTCDKDFSAIQRLRAQLKLLDTALTIECGESRKYRGPMLPRDITAKSAKTDRRLDRVAKALEEPLRSLFKGKVNIEHKVIIPQLPLNDLYTVDLMLSSSDSKRVGFRHTDERLDAEISPFVSFRETIALFDRRRLSEELKLRKVTAVFINSPEHFASDGTLLGAQQMRVRHFQAIGFDVVNLDYGILQENGIYLSWQSTEARGNLMAYLQSKFVESNENKSPTSSS